MDDEKKVDLLRFTESEALKKLREMLDASKVFINEQIGVHDSVTFDMSENHALDALAYQGTVTGRMSATSVNMQNIPRSQPHTIPLNNPLNEGRDLFRKTAESVYTTITTSARWLRRRYGGECLHRKVQAEHRIQRAYNQGGGEAGLQRVVKEQADLLLWLNDIMNEKRR